MLRALLTACLCLGASWAAGAAVPEVPRARIIGVADGLPSSKVNGMAFDHAGYLWLATTDGLARYDGIGMKVWRHTPGDPASLPGNDLTLVSVDDRDRIWVAAEGRGLSMMDSKREGFVHYRQAERPEIGSDDTFAVASRNGEVWFGTYGGGLHRLDRDGRITRFAPKPGDLRSLPAETVLSLAYDGRGDLWVGTFKGLARWTGSDFERVAVPGEEPAPWIFSVTPVGDQLWVGTKTGLYRREGDGRWTDPDYSVMFGHLNAVLTLAPDRGGNFWLGTQRSIWRVAPNAVPVPATLGPARPARPVQQIVGQEDGSFWFPFAGTGVGYLRSDWRRIAQYSRERGTLSSELYPSLAPSASGGLWLLGARGEIERLGADGVVEPVSDGPHDSIGHSVPNAAVEDRKGRLWVATSRNSVVRIDPSGVWRDWTVDTPEPALNGEPERMLIARDGTLWISFLTQGLQQRDTDTGKVLSTILVGPDQGIGVGDLGSMKLAPDGVLWVASGQGMLRHDAAGKRMQAEQGLPRERVFGFVFDAADSLWLQTLKGLEHYRRDGKQWRLQAQIGVAEGIPAVEATDLFRDRLGRIWMPTSRGLFRWDPKHRQLRHFGVQNGMSSQEFIRRGSTMTPGGVLASALSDGSVVLVDTELADPPPRQPRLQWHQLDVRRHGRWVPLPLQGSSLPAGATRAARYATIPSLAPDDREMRVQLRLLSFDDPQANRYYTRLEGYDSDWVSVGNSGERVFAGLPSGSYVLHARAVDANGNAAVERTLEFNVRPPWWRTPPALAALAGLVALLVWWIAASYRRRLQRRLSWQAAEHEREVAKQASLAKTRFLATLGHEVRTPMTGVLGMSELLLDTPLNERQRGYTESILRAGQHLLRLVNDALDLARIESGKLELADESFDLRALIEQAAELMRPLAQQRGLAFEVLIAPSAPRGLRGDASRVCQILLNLLGNAIKFTEQGKVSLIVDALAPQGVRFEVADTGPGLNEEQKARLFRRFEQADGARTAARYGGSGLGLAICQELAAAMEGHIAVHSEPGQGAHFVFELPLPNAEPPVGTKSPETATRGPQIGPLALLLVEDDPTVAEVIAGLLRAQGHRVTHVANGLAALAEVSTARFDLALLDLDLPGITGLDLARQLRAQGFAAPLVAVTARADADAEPQASEAGFDRFLRKPVTGAMLADTVAAVQAAKH
ncbi:hybrid sensor histidine kinase/response regulator [Lysobacter antibioticus]|uniref:hybrid sensor histidine kinase/response regulator n=1 Tax=Lysobacter antibioticus TaxID=84531 RepID=UPI00068EE01C|nr:hybrid sensor histidine kinase/response regulator [Lysobacter antibioticus]